MVAGTIVDGFYYDTIMVFYVVLLMIPTYRRNVDFSEAPSMQCWHLDVRNVCV